MSDLPVNVVGTVRCEKCNYRYDSKVTVFAVKDMEYESKCPQCSHLNVNRVNKERIEKALEKRERAPGPENEGGGGEDVEGENGVVDKRFHVPKTFRNSALKGLYISLTAVAVHLLGWFIVALGTGVTASLGGFLKKLSYPLFGVGIALLLFGIAIERKTG